MQIVLASGSPYRQKILAQIGLNFLSESPNIDETPWPNESADDLAQRLALQKARALALKYPDAIIIGCDQVGSVNGHILNKPGGFEEAEKQLTKCNGQRVRFHTGYCLLQRSQERVINHVEHFDVYFRQLTENQIHHYLTIEKPFDCAGSFKAEGLGIALFERFDGRDYNTLIGLPLMQIISDLQHWNIDVLANGCR